MCAPNGEEISDLNMFNKDFDLLPQELEDIQAKDKRFSLKREILQRAKDSKPSFGGPPGSIIDFSGSDCTVKKDVEELFQRFCR